MEAKKTSAALTSLSCARTPPPPPLHLCPLPPVARSAQAGAPAAAHTFITGGHVSDGFANTALELRFHQGGTVVGTPTNNKRQRFHCVTMNGTMNLQN